MGQRSGRYVKGNEEESGEGHGELSEQMESHPGDQGLKKTTQKPEKQKRGCCLCCCQARTGTQEDHTDGELGEQMESHQGDKGLKKTTQKPEKRKIVAVKPPRDETEVPDDATKIHLGVRLESMRKACRSFVVCYTKLQDETDWCEVARSELSMEATKFPNFMSDMVVSFHLYTQKLIRFEAYRTKHEQSNQHLEDQHYLGCVELNILEAVMARSKGDGWWKQSLKNLMKPEAPPNGKLAVWAEEDASTKNILFFDVSAQKLVRSDMWKPSVDPFLIIHRADAIPDIDNGPELDKYRGPVQLSPVIRSELHRRTRNPKFKRIKISTQALCQCKGKQKVVFEVWDWFRVGVPRLLGTGYASFDEIYKNFVDGKNVNIDLCRRKIKTQFDKEEFELADIEDYDPKKDSSSLVVGGVECKRTYSLLDFLRSGAEIVPIFAVDFTRSTGLRDAAMDAGRTSQPLPGDNESDYAETIQNLGSILEGFNSEKSFPCYAFGAKVPPTNSICSHAFALNGDFFAPEIRGVAKVLDMYHACLRVTRLHGPTLLNPLVTLGGKWARKYAEVKTKNTNNIDMKYFVLVIITSGGVQDQQEVVNTLVACTGLPISVVIIEIGNDEDPFLRDVATEVRSNQELREVGVRDFIYYARFNHFRGDPYGLAHATLYNIPANVETYYKAIDVQPRDLHKYEDDRGNPHPRQKVEHAMAPDKEAQHKEDLDESKAANVDLMDAFHAQEAAVEQAIANLPPFLQMRRQELLESSQSLGYSKGTTWRVLRDGVADDSLESLLDNILHTGYGSTLTFKECLQQEIGKKEKREASKRLASKNGMLTATALSGDMPFPPIKEMSDQEVLEDITGEEDLDLSPQGGSNASKDLPSSEGQRSGHPSKDLPYSEGRRSGRPSKDSGLPSSEGRRSGHPSKDSGLPSSEGRRSGHPSKDSGLPSSESSRGHHSISKDPPSSDGSRGHPSKDLPTSGGRRGVSPKISKELSVTFHDDDPKMFLNTPMGSVRPLTAENNAGLVSLPGAVELLS